MSMIFTNFAFEYVHCHPLSAKEQLNFPVPLTLETDSLTTLIL
jgi:hypothetical protein